MQNTLFVNVSKAYYHSLDFSKSSLSHLMPTILVCRKQMDKGNAYNLVKQTCGCKVNVYFTTYTEIDICIEYGPHTTRLLHKN